MLRYIVTFCEVVSQMSMVGASHRLKLTPAVVSKHIQSLEKELGLQLIKRSTRRLELTHEGVVYYKHAKLILEACQAAEAELSGSKAEPSGKLKVVCGSQFIDEYLLPYLGDFLSRHPKISVELVLSQFIPDLEKEKVDVIVGFTRGIPLTCIQRTLLEARWVLCASPEYLERHGVPEKPSDLEGHRLITHANREPNNQLLFTNGETIFCDPVICFNDTRAMRKCALYGVGIVLLHDYIVASDLKEGKLVELLPKYVNPQKNISLYIAYLQTKHVHLKVRKFVDFMVEITKKLS